MAEPKMRTVCHRCRVTETVRSVDRDGVLQLRHVPAAGDGEIVRVAATAGGLTAVLSATCPDCGGTGFLDGFVTPG